jgi:hypothetical protein
MLRGLQMHTAVVTKATSGIAPLERLRLSS